MSFLANCKKRVVSLVFLSSVSVTALLGQKSAASCDKCSASYIGNEELQAYLRRAEGKAVSDQQVRTVDAGNSNITLAIVSRGKLPEPTSVSVAEHDLVGEVYYVLDGSATLVTGTDMVEVKRKTDKRNGPGANAASIHNGTTFNLKAGDSIIIPAGLGHWFTKIDDHVRYIMVRIDPDKVTALKDEAASRDDLSGKSSAKE